MYLDHVAKLIKIFPRRVIVFNSIIDNPQRLHKTSYEEYDNAALFDYDFKEEEFRRNIEICDKLDKKYASVKSRPAKRVYHAFSNVNFDLWLILHKIDFNKSVSANHEYLKDLRRVYNLEKDADIKSEKLISKVLEQITLDDVKSAIGRADKIRNQKMYTDHINIGSSICYPNPDFSIHNFIKEVLVNCGEMIG
ncbi:hypothetical protein AMQ84_03505 [Paenibacillus riograndensis]|uniref:RloB-like protein n=2 Tax=Paenibacillus riograndensis TaxID=483937 RepID=A0A132UA22_9BACL|nr:hypothetical protein AMQ84_03505 [Paenibacillus riograndensis]